MPGHSTLAARCAILSSAITQILTDAESFARRIRESRHDINALNSDLSAIKLSLDIARDDFSEFGVGLPPLHLEAAHDLLECCATLSERLHKLIRRLSTIITSGQSWHVVRNGDITRLKQELGALRSALDIMLDLVILFIGDFNGGRNSTPLTNNKEDIGKLNLMEVEHSFLRRIDMEREKIEHLTEGRLPILYASFDRLRACTAFFLEERITAQELQKRSDSRSDSLDPASGDSPRSMEHDPSLLPSPVSPTHGIGAWIANVAAQVVYAPSLRPESIAPSEILNSTRARGREEETPSRGTFYAESTVSDTRTQIPRNARALKNKAKDRPKSYLPHIVAKMLPHSKSRQSAYYTASTIVSSEEASLFYQNITSDGIAISKGTRKGLTQNQRVAVDWNLRNIPSDATTQQVESILWEGASPNVEDAEFGFFIIRAAYQFRTPILQLLVSYNVDIYKTSSSTYFSPIHAAVLGRQLTNLQYLVELGVPIEYPNAHGETPLHLAVKTPGGYEIAKWLLECGADVNRISGLNSEGESPLQMCMRAKTLEARERTMIMELLFSMGAEGEVGAEAPVRRGKGLSVLGLI